MCGNFVLQYHAVGLVWLVTSLNSENVDFWICRISLFSSCSTSTSGSPWISLLCASFDCFTLRLVLLQMLQYLTSGSPWISLISASFDPTHPHQDVLHRCAAVILSITMPNNNNAAHTEPQLQPLASSLSRTTTTYCCLNWNCPQCLR